MCNGSGSAGGMGSEQERRGSNPGAFGGPGYGPGDAPIGSPGAVMGGNYVGGPERNTQLLPGRTPTTLTANAIPGGINPLGTVSPWQKVKDFFKGATEGGSLGLMAGLVNPTLAMPGMIAGGLIGGASGLLGDPYSIGEGATITGQYPNDPGGINMPGGPGGSLSQRSISGFDNTIGRQRSLGREIIPGLMPPIPGPEQPTIPLMPRAEPPAFPQYVNRLTGQPLTPEEFFNLLTTLR